MVYLTLFIYTHNREGAYENNSRQTAVAIELQTLGIPDILNSNYRSACWCFCLQSVNKKFMKGSAQTTNNALLKDDEPRKKIRFASVDQMRKAT